MSQIISQGVSYLNSIVWSPALVGLCLLVGLWFSYKTRFLQIRHWREMVRLLFKGESSEQGISSFQAFSVSVSGRVGTGNIAGVATAIALGGPGAVFWMWAIAFLGAGSAFVESVLAQIYKVEQDGEYRGGPAYYIEKGMGIKWYATLFAIATIIAMGVLLPTLQSNSIAAGLQNAFGLDPFYSGIGLVVLLAAIIFGGVKRIGRVAEFVVPFMAIAYITVALIIIVMNIRTLPEIFMLILNSAFGLEQTFAGIFGSAIAWGVKRGIFSNEAGQGTSPQAAAAAEVSHPVKQGLVQAFSVYIDTLFICSATAFMILITGMYNVKDKAGNFIVDNIGNVEIGPAYTQKAVESIFPGFGSAFVGIALLFFAFTTIMAYYYIAETNVAYLSRSRNLKWLKPSLRFSLLAVTFYGAVKTADMAWAMGDLGVGVMAWINIIAIIILQKPALIALKDYEEQKAMGLDPEFDPLELGIENAEFWEEVNSRKRDETEQKVG